MNQCPSEVDLRRLELLKEGDRSVVEDHIDSCRRCQATLKRMTDELAGELRGVLLIPYPQPKRHGGAGRERPYGADFSDERPDSRGTSSLRDPESSGQKSSEASPESAEQGSAVPPSFDEAVDQRVDTRIPPELIRHPRYTHLEFLGEGGMGRVFKAVDKDLDRTVAIKVIRREGLVQPKAVTRLRREARATAKLKHPNIVTVHDIEHIGRTCFIVMEFVEGTSLSRLVEKEGMLEIEAACYIGMKVSESLEECSRNGIIHRDVKPSNIMVDADWNVKVLDFGLARFAIDPEPDGPLTVTECVMGTPEFMAPEQAHSPHDADLRSDIYSLGCTLYFLLTASYPVRDRSQLRERNRRPIGEIRRDLPTGLAEMVGKMMADRPEDRYQSSNEVAEALAAFARTAHASANMPPSPPHSRHSSKRRFQTHDSLFHGTDRLSKHPRRTAMAMIGLFLSALLLWAAPLLIRIVNDDGQLVIETSDPDIEIVVKRGGRGVRIVDPKTDRTVDLKAGEYEIELVGQWEGVRVSPEKILVTRGGKTVVTIRRESPTNPLAKLPTENLRPAAVTTNSMGMKMGRVPAGEFLMGSPESDPDAFPFDKPQRLTRIKSDYLIGTHEVTQGQYQKVMGENPSHFRGPESLPVEQVSWFDAIAFCNKLSEREGFKPYYSVSSRTTNTTGRIESAKVTVIGGSGYRLPTEPEWEYACRAGTTTRYFFGDEPGELGEFAWFVHNSDLRTHRVGMKKHNAFGIYDMIGNVWEWCEQDPPESDLLRCFKGAAYSHVASRSRSVQKACNQASYWANDLGFRVVRTPD